MKVLFVSSGNKSGSINPIILNQGISLTKRGVSIEYYSIKGKGIFGYLKNVKALSKKMSDEKYDLIHAHYCLSGILSKISGAKPLVVSLMGSDVKGPVWLLFLSRFFLFFFWDFCIVKTEDMKSSLKSKKAVVIPNGVDFDKFYPVNREEALEKTGWDKRNINILFTSDPERPEKNYELAFNAVNRLAQNEIKLHVLKGVSNNMVVFYLNSASVVLLTSKWEGSPNIIKEAMACNLPIVSTEVGDVKEIIGSTEGCYLTTYDTEDVSVKLTKAIEFKKKTNGRQNIAHLDSELIAMKISGLYSEIVARRKKNLKN